MQVVSKKDFGRSITKGKEYDVQDIIDTNLIIVDDEGFRMGYSKAFFDIIEEYETWGQELFNYMSNEHGVTLLQQDMHEIIHIVKKMINNEEA